MRYPIDELGAHVSSAGGCANAPARAAEIGSSVLQLFTKTPNMWREPELDATACTSFSLARAEHEVVSTISHDSYLINLATPDPTLFERSYDSFRRELVRCRDLGVEYVVTHPGNATDGDAERGLAQNAEAIGRALEEVGGETMVLVETTAGAGKVLGATFEELARLIESVPANVRHRVGICLDTCHVWAAGYDLAGDYDGVMARLADVVGLERLRAFHLNDSKFGLGTRKDRHEGIGDGHLGLEPFRRIMTDERFTGVMKVLETPKGDDPKQHAATDRENLRRLRQLRAEAAGTALPVA
jgi:deoxyribonuclease-4